MGRENVQMVVNSLLMVTHHPELGEVRVRVVHIGGTLEKVEKALKAKSEEWLEALSLET